MKIIKRNGEIDRFYTDKIVNAITKAMGETEIGVDFKLAMEISKLIYDKYSYLEMTPTVEQVQDDIEELLATNKRFDVSKRYILYRNERAKVREQGWKMTELQKDIYEKKYRFENETFDEFLDRVSGGNSHIKKLMRDKKFIPAGRILAGRGLNEKGKKVCYSNCFVITPPEDNLESIFDTAKKMARTYSMGGGCGTSLENLRPSGAVVNNSAESTSGAVSFIDLYSTVTGLIGMKARRGALMITLPVTHPDIMEFINLKRDLDRATKANISVMINDDFMVAVKNNAMWEMSFEVKDTGEIIKSEILAKDVLYAIASSSHAMAEPGVLFWDKVKNWHLNSENENFEYASTNPCGEKPLPKGGSCLLSSLNLSEYVLYPFTEDAQFDYVSFYNDVKSVTIYMNELLDEGIQYLPLEEQRESAKKYRQLGIGIMGMADMFIKIGVKYGSGESKVLIERVLIEMANASLQQSALLAKEYGTYSAYDKDAVYNSYYLHFVAKKETIELIEKYGLRNAELLSIAPTGSISTMFGVSGGCEPIFQNSYTRKSESLGDVNGVAYYKVYTPIVKDYMDKFGLKNESELPYFFTTAMDLDYKDRIDIQSVLQLYIDSAISSTVNLPENTTIEEIMDLYMYAWEKDLKGITVYRDGCQRSGILISDKKKSEVPSEIEKLQEQMDKLITQSLIENPNSCPMCGGEMFHSGGCNECHDCGYSPCSI